MQGTSRLHAAFNNYFIRLIKTLKDQERVQAKNYTKLATYE